MFCADAAREARAECRGPAPGSDRRPRPREPGPAQAGTRMKPPSSPFDAAPGKRALRAYGRLLCLLRGRDHQDQRAIKEDAELLLDAARARGRRAFAATWLALMWDLLIVGTGPHLARAPPSL